MTGSSITCTLTHFQPTNKSSDFFLILKMYKIPKISINLSVLKSKDIFTLLGHGTATISPFYLAKHKTDSSFC